MDSCRTSSKASVLMGTILDGLDNSLRSEWNLSTFCSSHSVEQANNCSPFAFDTGFGVNPNPRGAVPVHWACPNFVPGVCVVIVNEDRPATYSIPHPATAEVGLNATWSLQSAFLKRPAV